MATSRNRTFAKLARNTNTDGDVTITGLATDVSADIASAGTAVYDSASLLPTSGLTAGDTAFVKSTSRLYLYSGVGWYNVAIINNTPTIQSITDSDGGTTPFALATDGTPTTITITAQDSDGDPLTYSYTADSDFAGLATISQDVNVFTITPFSQDSATTTSGTITFSITDGINTALPGAQTFTLSFLSPYWDEAVLSVGTSGTNTLDNSTFIDRSTNNHTITISGSPTQSSFHPYHTNWSNEFGDAARLTWTGVATPGTGDFTAEAWVFFTDLSNDWRTICAQRASNGASANQWTMGVNTTGYLYWYSDSMIMQSSAGLITTGQWYHVAISRSGTNTYMFIDGQVVATGTNNYNLNYTTFTINANADQTEPGNCFLSNVRFTVGEALYTANFTVPTENLTAGANTEILACASNRFVDLSGNNADPTITGGATVSAFNPFGQSAEYVPGENKGSSYFIGASNRLVTPTTADFSLSTNDFCYEGWVYCSNQTATAYPRCWGLGTYYNNVNSFGVLVVDDDNSDYITVYWNDGSLGRKLISSETMPENQWNHLAVVRSSNNFALFLNGSRIATYTSSNAIGSGDNFAYVNSTDNGSEGIVGYISDVRLVVGSSVYDPTQTTITPPTSPVGNTGASVYLPMDNAGIYDKTGNHALTLIGDTATSTTQFQKGTTSIAFDGSDSISLPSLKNSYPFSISTWVYFNSFTAWSGFNEIMNLAIGAQRVSVGTVNWNGTNGQSFCIFYGGSNHWSFRNATPLQTNTWYHVVFSVVGSNNAAHKVYINGQEVTNVLNGGGSHGGTAGWNIGSNSASGEYLDGYLDQFTFYNKALSSAEALQIYQYDL